MLIQKNTENPDTTKKYGRDVKKYGKYGNTENEPWI